MAVERLRQQVGILSFTNPLPPDSVTVGTGTTTIVDTRPSRAFCVVTNISTGPVEFVFAAQDAFPNVDAGIILPLNVPQTFFGPLRLRATSASGGHLVIFQDFDVAPGVALP